MEIIKNILETLSGLSLSASIIYLLYVVGNMGIKLYSRFKLGVETQFILTTNEKLILWISTSIIFTKIIQ